MIFNGNAIALQQYMTCCGGQWHEMSLASKCLKRVINVQLN